MIYHIAPACCFTNPMVSGGVLQFSMCLRDLAEKKKKEYQGTIENQRMGYVRESRHESWARGALDPDSSVRVGFPDLRKQWEEALGQNDGGSTNDRPQQVPKDG